MIEKHVYIYRDEDDCCDAQSQGGYWCTLPACHEGPHKAYSLLGNRLIETWSQDYTLPEPLDPRRDDVGPIADNE